MRVLIAFLVLLCATCSPSAATDTTGIEAAALVNAGTDAYQRGDFAEAASLYEAAAKGGHSNGKLFYNLGNAYFRLNRIGDAIGCYRQALVDLPHEEAVWSNLNLARKKVKDPVATEHSAGVPLTQAQLWILTGGLGRPQLQSLFAALYLCYWIAVAAGGWKQSAIVARLRVVAAVACIWLAVPLLSLGQDSSGKPVLKSPFSTLRYGVVIPPTAEAFAGDSTKFQVVAVLHEGAEIVLGEEREEWSEVLLPNGRKGWINRAQIRSIVS